MDRISSNNDYLVTSQNPFEVELSDDFHSLVERICQAFQNALDTVKINVVDFRNTLFTSNSTSRTELYAINIRFNRALKQAGLSPQALLGKGGFGSVYLSEGSPKVKEKDLAVKILDPFGRDYDCDPFSNETPLHTDEGEGAGLFVPKGSHLARTYGAFVWDSKARKVHYVTQETAEKYKGLPILATVSRAQRGDLFSIIPEGVSMLPKAIKGYGKNIAKAIHDLHDEGLLHLDIKPHNVLIKKQELGKDPYRIKLTDFGCSATIDPFSNGHHSKFSLGTPFFVAPETLERIEGKKHYGKPADWYSFGVTLYMMATGDVALPLDIEGITDDNLRDLLTGLLNKDPEQRLTGPEVLNHPFFKN